MKSAWLKIIIFFSTLGLIEAGYLSYKHYTGGVVPCSVTRGCEAVLSSQYSEIFGIPISFLGMLFYATVLVLAVNIFDGKARAFIFLFIISSIAFAVSLVLVYLQFFVIKAVCAYCLTSAGLSTIIFSLAFFSRNKMTRSVIMDYDPSLDGKAGTGSKAKKENN